MTTICFLRTTIVVVASLVSTVFAADVANFDRFNYDSTVQANGHNDYGPEDWNRVQCPDTETCLGYPDSFDEAIGWSFRENSCRSCPPGRNCGTHHQSPINLYREVTLTSDPLYNKCIDGHWMKYHDSTCTWDELVRNHAFSIERHTLKIIQPTELMADGKYQIACQNPARKRRFGRLDYAKGFSHWWHLSHIDLHVPSEHTQNGKRYDGELQMYQFYSVSGQEAGVDNEMGTVSVFLQAYDDSPDYDMLNRVICQWREVEQQTRSACGLSSVNSSYEGCRVHGGRQLRTVSNNTTSFPPHKPMSAHDIILLNYLHPDDLKVMIVHDDPEDDVFTDQEWTAFIEQQEQENTVSQNRRHLTNYDHVGPWHNYWPLLGVRTEYYYRYGGTQTVPPCYGRFVRGNKRGQTNHWRVMKDPIRISKRQLTELHRLLRERIAPSDDPLVACQADTAAKVDSATGLVDVARPVQGNHKAHHMVFCECENWGSKWQADKDWCRTYRNDKNARLFQHPYNFYTEGF